MSGDLISRAKAIAMHKTECSGECDCCRYITKDLECGILHNVPAVDAEPVRHGRWIENGDDDMDAGMWHCSKCGHEIYTDLSLMEEMQEQGYALYCEHCGAKMDEEGEK